MALTECFYGFINIYTDLCYNCIKASPLTWAMCLCWAWHQRSVPHTEPYVCRRELHSEPSRGRVHPPASCYWKCLTRDRSTTHKHTNKQRSMSNTFILTHVHTSWFLTWKTIKRVYGIILSCSLGNEMNTVCYIVKDCKIEILLKYII